MLPAPVRWLALALIISIAGTIAARDDDPVTRAIEELQALRLVDRRESAEAEQTRDSLRRRLTELSASHLALREELASLRQQAAALDTEDPSSIAPDPRAAKIAALLEDLLPILRRSPVSARRVAAAETALRDLTAGDPVRRWQGVSNFAAMATEELPLMASCEVTSALTEVSPGRQLHCYHLRLGLVWEGIISEDGTVASAWKPGQGYVPIASPGLHLALTEAIQILRDQRGPALLPFPMSALSGEARSSR